MDRYRNKRQACKRPFYNTDTKKLFRFIKDGENYTWEDFQDSEIQKALEDAATAKDTADGKRRVFINTPLRHMTKVTCG